jgi:hypothetical protein
MGHITGGDVVLVKNGTYNEDGLYIYGPAGTSVLPTILKAYPGHSPSFKGLGDGGRIAIDGTSDITIEGLEIWNLNQCVYIRNAAHHIVIRNCNIHDSGNELCHVDTGSHDVVFENNHIHDGGTIGTHINGEGLYIGNSGVVDNTYNVTLRSNRVHNTLSEGIELKPGTHDCVVEYNDVSTNNTGSVPAASIEVDETSNFPSNPNHIVRANKIHDAGAQSHGIRAGTGCSVYNNIVYNLSSSKYAISVDNLAGDSYPRQVYNNTLDVPPTRAVLLGGGLADVKNNIGPSSTGNKATSTAYYIDAGNHNYNLVRGSAPVDAGADLSTKVPIDYTGIPRPAGSAFDLGAYEYVRFAGMFRAPVRQGAILLLDFSGFAGMSYVLESTTQLLSAAWVPVSTNVAGSNGEIIFNLAATNSVDFYRARLAP